MKTREAKSVSWLAASLLLCVVMACSVTVVPDDDGVTGTVTIANKTFNFKLGSTGVFEIYAEGTPARNAAQVQPLFSEPSDNPQSGVIALNVDDVDVIPLSTAKTQVFSQTVTGSAELGVYIGPASSTNPCDEGTYLGQFTLTFDNGVVSIDQVELELSSAALAEVVTGTFTICLEMTGTVNAQITIDGMNIIFGPPIDEPDDGNANGNDNGSTPECFSDSDCAAGEVCTNGECVPDTTAPECTDDLDCAEGEICDAGVCVPETTPECVTDADCAEDETCIDGACVAVTPECTADADCAEGESCIAGECVPEDLYALTISISGQGSVDPPSGAYEQFEQVTLTPTAADGWRFDRWTGDLTGRDNPASVTISADTGITAVFVEEVASTVTFRATYDRLWDTDEQFTGYYFDGAVLSGDGQKMMWLTRNSDGDRRVVIMDFDGGNQTTIPVPDSDVDEGYEAFREAAIDQDGSRAFFTRGYRYIFKVEGGAITQVMDRWDWGIASVDRLQATADGNYVYFLDDDVNDNDVWRVAHSGGEPELVIDDVDVILDNGYSAAQVADFAVSGDGGTIVFTVHGYWGDSYVSQGELFVLNGGTYTQLTYDRADYTKTTPRISGDGSTIVFARSGESWYSVSPDGSNEVNLGATGYNLGGPKLTYDGAKMFYSDSASGGGVLLNTDGSGRLSLFPAWNIVNIAIGPTYYHAISDDGTRICFYTQYGILPENAAFYVGYLDELNVATPSVADAPYISAITKAPASMARGDEDAIVMFSIAMTDADGLDDITNTAADEMLDGLHYSWDDIPAYFSYDNPYDTGEGVDLAAGDGDFALVAYPANLIDTVDSMTVRISAMDASKTVVVADTVLTVGSD